MPYRQYRRHDLSLRLDCVDLCCWIMCTLLSVCHTASNGRHEVSLQVCCLQFSYKVMHYGFTVMGSWKNMTLVNSKGLLYFICTVLVTTGFSELQSTVLTKELSYYHYCYWFKYFWGPVLFAFISLQDVNQQSKIVGAHGIRCMCFLLLFFLPLLFILSTNSKFVCPACCCLRNT